MMNNSMNNGTANNNNNSNNGGKFIMANGTIRTMETILADKLGISDKQLTHVTNSEPGSGLILFDNVVIPFVDKYPTDTKTYAIMNTKPEEAVKKDEAS